MMAMAFAVKQITAMVIAPPTYMTKMMTSKSIIF
jgi:hypothetical protein